MASIRQKLEILHRIAAENPSIGRSSAQRATMVDWPPSRNARRALPGIHGARTRNVRSALRRRCPLGPIARIMHERARCTSGRSSGTRAGALAISGEDDDDSWCRLSSVGRTGDRLRIADRLWRRRILLQPLTAMQFTDEVDWTLGDFIIAALMQGSVGLALELTMRTSSNPAFRAGVEPCVLADPFMSLWLHRRGRHHRQRGQSRQPRLPGDAAVRAWQPSDRALPRCRTGAGNGGDRGRAIGGMRIEVVSGDERADAGLLARGARDHRLLHRAVAGGAARCSGRQRSLRLRRLAAAAA